MSTNNEAQQSYREDEAPSVLLSIGKPTEVEHKGENHDDHFDPLRCREAKHIKIYHKKLSTSSKIAIQWINEFHQILLIVLLMNNKLDTQRLGEDKKVLKELEPGGKDCSI